MGLLKILTKAITSCSPFLLHAPYKNSEWTNMSLALAPLSFSFAFSTTLSFPCTATMNPWKCEWRNHLKLVVKHDLNSHPLWPPLHVMLCKVCEQVLTHVTCKVHASTSAPFFELLHFIRCQGLLRHKH